MKRGFLGILFFFALFGCVPAFPAHAALTDSLISFWELDETSGSRADSLGTNSLTDNNTVTSTTGKVGNAAQFTSANSESLSHTDSASLSTGDIDFTVAGWVYLDAKTTTRDLISKFNGTGNQREYIVWWNSSTDRLSFSVSSTGADLTTVAANTLGVPSTSTWYYIVAWHDASANTINIQVNNGTVDSAAYSSGVFDSTADFYMGSRVSGATFFSGRMDAVGFWKRTLTSGERTSLYNSGSGVEHPFVPNVPTSLNATPGSGEVALTWTAPTSTGYAVTDYVVEYKLTSEPTTWTTFADGTSTSTNATVTGLTPSLSYDFRVSATNSLGTGATSSTASATPTSGVPSTPTVLLNTPGDTQVSLTWTAPGDGGSAITDYVVEYKLSSEPTTWTTFADGTSTSTNATVTGLTNNLPYDFRVSATNGIGTGSVSGTTSAVASDVELKRNLFAFWKLEEASGTRDDAALTNDLADNNTVTSTTGKVGNAAQFTAANSESLSLADNALLSTGDIDFTVAGWVYLDAKTTTRDLFTKYDTTGSQREYTVWWNSVTDRLSFSVSSTGADLTTLAADSLGAPSISTWYYIVAWHDAAANTLNIKVNNGTTDSVSYSSGVFDSTGAFILGARTAVPVTTYFDGRMDAVGFWKRTLTSGERTSLYNLGSGVEYPFTIPNAIELTTPVAYQTFQRNGSDLANITITGNYTGSPTAIEASWNGGAYATIDSSLSGGTFSGTLTNQSVGQGTLTVRFTNDTGITDTAAYVGIGDIFVIAGQSNAMGYGFNNQSYSHASLKAALFANDDNWKNMTDPTDSNTNQVDSVSSDASAAGSVWPLFATLFMADQGVPVAFIPTARSGSAISEWQRNDSDPGDLTTLYGSMYRRITEVGDIKAVLFWQGERDAGLNTSEASYKSQLVALADDIQLDFGVKLVDAEIGNRFASGDLNNIRLAKQSAWDDAGNVLPGPVLYDVEIQDEGGDTVHFRSDADLQVAANRFWAALDGAFYGAADDGRGPRLVSTEENTGRTTITVIFSDDTLPIIPSSSIEGFVVEDNGSPVTVSTVTRVASDTARITLASALTGTATISLGEQNTGSGLDVPKDSSTYNLPAEVFVDEAVGAASAPTVAEVTAVTTPTTDTTPNYTFSTTQAGTITYGGSCSSATTAATVGNNTITFSTLSDGTYTNCTIKVTDDATNESNTLTATSFTVDTTAPTIAEVTPVSTPTTDTTPNYTFSSTEAGTITYGGSCSSATTSASSGSNTITFTTLSDGTYTNCTIKVTDDATNESNTLTATSFTVATTTAPNAPTTLAASAGDTDVELTWTAPVDDGGSAITDYLVEYKLSSSGTWGTFADGTSTATLATVTGLTNDLAYDFRVSAINAIGTSSPSSTDSATPTSSSPAPSPSTSSAGSGYTTNLADIPGYTAASPHCSPGALFDTMTGALCSTATPSVPTSSTAFSFTRDLKIGDTGMDVQALQQFLNTHGFILALTGPGSPGNETERFGTLTHAALIRFQDAHAAQILTPLGLTRGTGYFGVATRAFISTFPF